MIRKFFYSTILLFFALILTNCSLVKQNVPLTPEEAAIQHVRDTNQADFRIDKNSVNAIQISEINDLILVLVQYSGNHITGGAKTCEMVLEAYKKPIIGWKTKNGAGSCHEINYPANTTPITVVSNWGNSTVWNSGYSTAFGYVHNSQVTEVVVTWEDGLVQPVEVLDSTYFAAREGKYCTLKIDVYNNKGDIVFTNNMGTGESRVP